ncbi:amino acid ABC transporter substrate-binding protein [Magnetospirillum sp. SS-4]|uniref:amino acid ABC transporter substrate-binding protein n=1 Tax=Magnetospirillum sp. SS-4 TaxID=2681465 RepID=UPI00138305D9|nr:amino acid ABC transporter substrate-binding protein [Magnetospirillum sp. SS-4]CAA7615851.1 General L-amino acid-binding periplasmic protein AapJ [Magnetospirillum sp. SS-4]
MLRGNRWIWALAVVGLILGLTAAPDRAAAGTLDEIKARGVVRCGVNEYGPALTAMNENGQWAGFYTDFCRAFAAATLGNARAVDFISVSSVDRFDALRQKAVDLLSEASTWTLERDLGGLAFPATVLMDGQGFLVQRNSGIGGLDQLKGRRVCVVNHATSVGGLKRVDKARNLGLKIQEYSSIQGSFAAFFDRQCEAVSTDGIILASLRQQLAPNPAEYVFLPERVTREPLSPVVLKDDRQWEDVVRWTVLATIAAEELGITSVNVRGHLNSSDPEVRRLLGLEGDTGARLGLEKDWAVRVIEQVGNYGEIYARNLTKVLGIERGQNALSGNGGVLWSPPFR